MPDVTLLLSPREAEHVQSRLVWEAASSIPDWGFDGPDRDLLDSGAPGYPTAQEGLKTLRDAATDLKDAVERVEGVLARFPRPLAEVTPLTLNVKRAKEVFDALLEQGGDMLVNAIRRDEAALEWWSGAVATGVELARQLRAQTGDVLVTA